jgi:hypothetical protein
MFFVLLRLELVTVMLMLNYPESQKPKEIEQSQKNQIKHETLRVSALLAGLY